MRSLRDSLITRIGVALGAVILLALVNIAVSLFVSASARGDAAAINQSGLIRMETQRLITRAERFDRTPSVENRRSLERQIDTVSMRLRHPQLISAIPGLDHPVGERYQRLRLTWNEFLKPHYGALLYSDAPLGPAPVMARTFIEDVDAMVAGLESRTESRITLLGVIQGLSLLLTLAVVSVLFLDFRRNVLQPLGRLVAMAQAVSKQDFSLRTRASGRDELSLLGQTFDRMADELSVRYANLEARAESKTKELERSHRALQLLHKASRSLYGSTDLCEGSVPLLQQLESLLDIGPVSLYLHESENGGSFEAVTTFARTRPEHCRSFSCDACLTGCHVLEDQPEAHRNRLLLPVRTGEELLGTLEVWYARDRILQHHERQLLETLADQLATAVYLDRRMTEQKRLTLMEERAVIARELHDSLAQSLSYLKMQVARLQRLQRQHDSEPGPREAEVVQDLRDGLDNGYRQLRELLTTFRLQFDSPGLEEALKQTAQEFSERLGFPVDLDYSLTPRMFSPNEEIHVLQIVREALANVHKHAQASHAQIGVYQQDGTLMVEVRDNGIGLPSNGTPPSHYGLVIMRDRSLTLGGELNVANAEGGGTVVCLAIPQQVSSLITRAS